MTAGYPEQQQQHRPYSTTMETAVQPREAVLDFGLLPLQVICPQLETAAGVQAAHRSLAAVASRGDHGNSKCSCSRTRVLISMVCCFPFED